VATYRVDYGTASSNLNQSVTVSGTAAGVTINGLAAGTYYFTVSALNSNGSASIPSNPVSRTFP